MSYTETLPDHPGTWTANDAWASEREVGEFFYGLTRLLKPVVALETGCYEGHTSKRIAEALQENKAGKLFSCDINKEKIDKAWSWCNQGILLYSYPLPVDFILCTGEELCLETENVDLAFLDSSGDRVAEALALKLSPRGIVVLHDARRDTLATIIEKTGWQSIFVDTPRGLAILQPKR